MLVLLKKDILFIKHFKLYFLFHMNFLCINSYAIRVYKYSKRFLFLSQNYMTKLQNCINILNNEYTLL